MILKIEKLTSVEKFVIKNDFGKDLNTRHCNTHGVFQKSKTIDDEKCPYCKKQCEIVENLQQIKDILK